MSVEAIGSLVCSIISLDIIQQTKTFISFPCHYTVKIMQPIYQLHHFRTKNQNFREVFFLKTSMTHLNCIKSAKIQINTHKLYMQLNISMINIIDMVKEISLISLICMVFRQSNYHTLPNCVCFSCLYHIYNTLYLGSGLLLYKGMFSANMLSIFCLTNIRDYKFKVLLRYIWFYYNHVLLSLCMQARRKY